uniref:Small ribosomal subunit protein eS6 n=1 Tax=Molossus molossus TaxID=27622 RepID=A0A7J8GRI4_MOLMO|nr:hypothetical protein HJG59_011303 [Molossus molossus]
MVLDCEKFQISLAFGLVNMLLKQKISLPMVVSSSSNEQPSGTLGHMLANMESRSWPRTVQGEITTGRSNSPPVVHKTKSVHAALFRGASEAVGCFRMKLNISFPATGCQKLIEVDDERKLRTFYEKRMATEVAADALGEEWKGYVVPISGGNDKQGFPMQQGVLTHGRVRLLLSKGHSCYRPRRTGERKRRSVRGCIVDANLSVLSLVIVKKRGERYSWSH